MSVKFSVVTVLVLALLASACSQDPPRVRVRNERPTEVDVELKPPSGATIHIDDVAPGTTTAYATLNAGIYEVDANITGVSASVETFFSADTDRQYTVVVVNSTPPTVRIDSP